jgi:hypothetical protein
VTSPEGETTISLKGKDFSLNFFSKLFKGFSDPWDIFCSLSSSLNAFDFLAMIEPENMCY